MKTYKAFIVFTFLFILFSKVGAIEFERGDAMFSTGFMGNIFGHTMLYYRWNSSLGSPDFLNNHELIEAVGTGTKSRKISIGQRSFWDNGSFTKENPTWVQRNNILIRGEQLVDKDYPEPFEFIAFYKGPKYRCDGLVEECYESANIDIIPGDTGVTLTPRAQYNAMQPSVINKPSISIIKFDKKNVEAISSDDSGITEAELWDGLPGFGKRLSAKTYMEEEQKGIKSDSARLMFDFNLDETNGTHILYLKSFDGAGNSSISNAMPVSISTPAKIIKIIPLDKEQNVSTDSVITILFDRDLLSDSIKNGLLKLYKEKDNSIISGEIKYDNAAKTIFFKPSKPLEAGTNYRIELSDEIRDIGKFSIDGNSDGREGGKLVSTFKTSEIQGIINKILNLLSFSWVVPNKNQVSVNQINISSSISVKSLIDNTKSSAPQDIKIIEPGDKAELSLTLTNSSTFDVKSVYGILSSKNNIKITANMQNFGDVISASNKSNFYKFAFEVPSDYKEQEIEFNLEVKGKIGNDDYVDNIIFKVPIGMAVINPPGIGAAEFGDWGFYNFPNSSTVYYEIDDNTDENSVGNGNGQFDYGDYNINISFYVGNAEEYVLNPDIEFSYSTDHINVNDGAIKNIILNARSYQKVSFNITPTFYLDESRTIPIVVAMTVDKSRRTKPFNLFYSGVAKQSYDIQITSIDPPKIFSPNGDGQNDSLIIKYKPSVTITPIVNLGTFLFWNYQKEDGSWTGWQDKNSILVNKNELIKNNEYSIAWNNCDGFKSGLYQISIGATYVLNEGYGNHQEWSQSKPITIYMNKTQPQAKNMVFEDDVKSFSPYNPGTRGSINLSFVLDEISNINVEVKDINDKVVRKIYSGSFISPGRKEYNFDSFNDQGEAVNDGQYYFYVYLDDTANPPISFKKYFRVDHSPQEFFLDITTNEAVSNSKMYELKWISASFPHIPTWNHLKKYQIMGRKLDSVNTDDFILLRDNVSAEVTSVKVSFPLDGLWEIKVRAIDEEGNWSESDGASSAQYKGDTKRNLKVLVDTLSPKNFLILSPKSDDCFGKVPILIKWEESADLNLAGYKIIISKNPNLSQKDSYVFTRELDATMTSLDYEPQITQDINYLYLFVIAYDVAGNRTVDMRVVRVDIIPPTIENFSISEKAFSPNNDKKKDTIACSFFASDNISKNLKTTIKVSNEKNVSVASLEDISLNNSGSKIFTWNGLTLTPWSLPAGRHGLDTLIPFPDGEYLFKITIEDEAGNIVVKESPIFVLDTVAPKVSNLNAQPNPFTPNNDKVDDYTNFSFNLSEAAQINLNIMEEKRGLVLNSELGIRNSSFESWVWDGRGSHNELVRGKYDYFVLAEDLAGNLATSESKTIFVDVAPSLVPYIYANPDPFSSFIIPTKLKYYLARDNLMVTLKILGENNQVLKKLIDKEKQDKGAHEVIWTGDCDFSYKGPKHSKDPSKITDGTYEFVIEVEDKEGVQPAIISNTVRVDSTPPYLLLKPVEIDYVYKKIKFVYTVPEKAKIKVQAYKEADNSLLKDFDEEEKNPGQYTFEWLPQTLAASPCYFKVTATDLALNTAEAKTEIFSTVPQNIFKLSGFTSLPNTFTPNGDGYLDQAKISYKIEGGVTPYKVSIDILSASGASIKKIIDHEDQSSGSQSFYWTGLLDPGPLTLAPGIFVSDGEYYCEIRAEDALGKKIEEKVKIIAVSTKPEIKISIDPVAFSPNADGSQDVMKVSYSVNYSNYISLSSSTGEGRQTNSGQSSIGQGEVKFEVYDKDNQIVLTKYFNHTPGNYSFTLDPLVPGNLGTFSDGEYVLRAFIEDALGSPGLVQSSSFKIDNVKPSLSILSLSPREFSPNGDSRKDNLFISYGLSKKAQITAQVLDSQDQLVHTLIDHAWTEKYEPMSSLSSFTGEGRKAISKQLSKQQGEVRTLTVPGISWDGSTPRPMGEGPGVRVVLDGSYKLRIFATDEAGNSSYLLESILIDTQFPIAPQISNLPGHTNIQAQFIQGTGEAQALAYLYNNEILIAEKIVEANGSFSFPVNLLAGDNSFKVKVEDAAGNISAYSNVVNAFYETTAPQITSFEVSPKIAKAGNVLITFEASEPLAKNPTVKVNSNSALLQSSNGNQYTYIYAVSSSDKQGTADISIELEDLAGNLELVRRSYLGEGGTFSIDTQNIVISEVDISPYYASAESEVAVSFSVNEKLFKLPELSINNNKLSFSSSQEISNTKYQYEYKYKIQPSDMDNAQTLLKISVEDLAHNITLESYAFVVDKTAPQVLDLNVEKDPAKAEDMKISFKVSEPLSQAPIVKIKQNGDIVKTLIPLGDPANNLSAIYNVVSGFDGTAQITVEVIDKALNANIGEKTFVVDTIKPEFTDLKCEIELNQDFSRYAKLNSKVKITFKSSEALKFNPDVEINGNLAVFTSFLRKQESSREFIEYTYEYTITSQDKAGVVQLKISGSDLADNFGENTFDAEKDTFVIDLTSPIVEIENNSALIANPSHFSTNANPLGSEPKSTTLQYKISEYGKVTLNIHKIPNDKTTYERSDFNAGSKVAVIVNGQWLDGGSHSVIYDGKIVGTQNLASMDTNNDGFVDPGKYAFIVEVKDRAGNVTERLWGGTFWIQDNILKVEEPDQKEIGGTNPDPKYFSPQIIKNKSKFHFKILLGITPKQYKDPERIEVLGIQDDIAWITGEAKKAGTYTVRIYDVSNNLIRTIVENKEFYTATNYYEEWDGFSLVPGSLGPLIPVPDGKYYFEIEVKDYSGNPALVNNKMRKEVYVDNTLPEIINPYAGGINEWKNASRANDLYNVDFKDANSKLKSAFYKIKRPDNTETTWKEIFNSTTEAYTNDWEIDFTACQEGVNYISIKSQDQAGNENLANNAFYIKKDTQPPYAPLIKITKTSLVGEQNYTNIIGVKLDNLSAQDDQSKIVKMKIWNDGDEINAQTFDYAVTKVWNIKDVEGERKVYVQYQDEAGNWSSSASSSIFYDKTVPVINSVIVSPNPFSPGASPGKKDSTVFDINISESGRLKVNVAGVGDIYSQSVASGNNAITWSPGASIGEGNHVYTVSLFDLAGNEAIKTGSIVVDNTPPGGIPGASTGSGSFLSATSGNQVANLSWSAVSDADGYNIYRANSYNGTYAQVNSSLVNSTTYQDTGLSNGTRYWYKISSADNAGNESGLSDYFSARPISSLNSTWIAFQRNGYDTYIIKPDGTNLKKIATGDDPFLAAGKYLYYVKPNDSDVYRKDIDTFTEITIQDYNNGLPVSPSAGPNAELLCSRYLDNSGYQVYLENTKLTSSSNFKFYWNPSFSPDSQKILYDDHSNVEAFIMNRDGSSKIMFANGYGGAFSPDGMKIAYYRESNASGKIYTNIYLKDLKTQSENLLVSHEIIGGFANGMFKLFFSPDGKKIVYTAKPSGTHEIRIIDIESKNDAQLTSDGSHPTWSTNEEGMTAFSIGGIKADTVSTSLEAISPVNGENVKTPRPTFKWYGLTGVQKYKIECTKPGLFQRDLTKTFSSSEVSSAKPALSYMIHEFDEGLQKSNNDLDFWNWKIKAYDASDVVTAESTSNTFLIIPDLTLEEVINYPNPFNPKREMTKIRYRLSRDAEWVKIRIYDLVGSLVRELDGTTNAEGVNIFQKYNDVTWDGLNGRGDMVLNGVYPFEVTAKLGDRIVSGRGKIAVLK